MYSEFIESATSLDDLEHDCSSHLELRERMKGSGTAYAYQCQRCGEAKGGEVSKRKVAEKPQPFNTDLPVVYERKRKALLQVHLDNLPKRNASIPAAPTVSPLHEVFSSKVDSILKELAAEYPDADMTTVFQSYLRKQRAEAINEQVSRWNSEVELSEWFKGYFSEWFEIHEEVPGVGYVNREKQRVRIDFIIKAKPHLVSQGFTDQYVGVEVKFFDTRVDKGFHGKSSRGIFQALSYWYSGAVWQVGDSEPDPLATVLLFSNLSFSDERERLFNTFDNYYNALWRSYLSVANHSNVGELQVKDYGRAGRGWAMEYNGAKYFSKSYDGRLVPGNPNVINKARIGNSQSRR